MEFPLNDDCNNVNRFSGRADDYAQYRPGYPDEVIDVIRKTWPSVQSGRIADIGCGPGISSEPFLRAGYTVVGVEPNTEMLRAAQRVLKKYPQFEGVIGAAAATTLPDQSVDLVIAAQAFHWFNLPLARRELIRIARPPHRVAVLFNTLRTDTPYLCDYEELLQEFAIDYRAVNHKNLGDDAFDSFFLGGWKRFDFPNVQTLDWPGVQGRLRSSSFMPAQAHERFDAMMQRLRSIFDRHQIGGVVHYEYETEVYCGELGVNNSN